MTELRRPKAYLTYPIPKEENAEEGLSLRDLLLCKVENAGESIIIGDKKFDCSRQIPRRIVSELIKTHGAIIVPNENMRYRAAKKVLGIPEAESKVVVLDGEKHIQVRITADNVEELFTRISDLKKRLMKFGIVEKKCAWDRLGKITVDYKRPNPKFKPEFNAAALVEQRSLELESVREGYQ